MSDSATPGWYHAEGDPINTERYWDGSAWTDGPRPVGGFPPAPPTPPMVPMAGTYAGAYVEASQATTALVLSILGFFCCITAPIGAFVAYREKEAIDAGRRDPANRGTAVAALVIGLSLFALIALGLVIAVAAIAISS
jgi:hypothetical protein